MRDRQTLKQLQSNRRTNFIKKKTERQTDNHCLKFRQLQKIRHTDRDRNSEVNTNTFLKQ